MPGTKVPPAVVVELQRQLNHEYAAAHAYTAMAIWCESANLKGFAKFFSKQAGEEREHATKIVAHLVDRGVAPELDGLPAPINDFKSVRAVAERAQVMEQANTKGIHTAYAAALKHNDYPAQVMLQWFISEQVEEEAWTDELVERVIRAECPGSLAELDRHLERHLTGTGLDVGEDHKD